MCSGAPTPARRRAGRPSAGCSRAEAAEAPLDGGADGSAGSALRTDLAGALRRALSDVPSGQLAGVIVVSDGRHNAPEQVAPLARRLAREQVPVCTVVLGSERPPRDAAVAGIEAPDVVYAGDSIHVAADLKLDGMAGSTANVLLLREDTVVHSQAVPVPASAYRTRVELSDTPPETGLLSYRVRVEAVEGEAFADNNEYPLTVSVTDDQVHLLLVEGLPRWEYRYLKNLFSGRDKTVRLQHVLFQPERVAGREERLRIAASASRPAGEAEAARLPESEAEWLRFDVIILGDVSPADLPAPAQEAVRRFVVDRGGTLVAVAGPRFMPHAFAGTPLSEVLPVTTLPAERRSATASTEARRIALTPEGADSVLMRLKPDAEENAALWLSRPTIHWRHAASVPKPAAAVLAYAVPPDVADPEQYDRQYREQNALVVVQNAGLGQAVFLAFDRTWRLRYREGDTYHHRFWGQVLRWATAGKLPAGTALVKLGTDRARYPLHCRVHVRARMLGPDLAPLVSDEAAVAVYRDDGLVLRRRLAYIGDQPGTYVADLGELPSGAYRVELEGPEVRAALAEEGVERVVAEFSVDPAASSELIELGADWELPGLLAGETGGVAVGPAEAMRVLEALGASVLSLQESSEYALWDSWPLLALMLGLATAEWVLRRKVGLP
ncbi:MAG: hypothetical protein AMK73_09640 [Planctomycetes bacterium SM23_32]|nr:MAG: hypothetical protein AMK73_09640 [Planctomycetes bacterium SM23_32]